MKAFQLIQTFGSIVVILVMILVWGIPLAPALMYYDWVTGLFDVQSDWGKALLTGLAFSSSAIVYSFSLLTFSASLQFILHVRVKEKTVVPLASFSTIRWAFCGQILRSTQPVLQHFVPSFVSNIYYRVCGAKIGKNTQINTHRLNDPCLIRIDDDCVIAAVQRSTVIWSKKVKWSSLRFTWKKGLWSELGPSFSLALPSVSMPSLLARH